MPQSRETGLYLKEDSIAAIATGLGGAIAIIRTSGPEALGAARALSHTSDLGRFQRAPVFGARGDLLDDAMIAVSRAPASFTGEDVVEYHIHGSPLIATRLLAELRHLGLRQALPGEFSFRAVRNGKLSLAQAQALPEILSSENESALRLALDKLSGEQNRFVSQLAEDLKRICMLGEVGIDFSDQDVAEVGLERLKGETDSSLGVLTKLLSTYERGQRLQYGVRTVLVGLPNAGKSSLFNSLLGEERSIVTEIPGTTRDVVKETMTLQDGERAVTFRFEDTAGLRSAVDRVERLGVERSEAALKSADLVVWVVDVTSLEDARPDNALGGRALPIPAKTVIVLNKKDLLPAADRERRLEGLRSLYAAQGYSSVFSVSAKDPEDVHLFSGGLVRLCGAWVERGSKEILLTREDQRGAIQEAIVHIERARQAPTLDLFSADLRQALHSLEPFIGATVPDDILGQIFAEFCIGK